MRSQFVAFHALSEVSDAQRRIRGAEWDLATAVRKARQQGASWRQIADRLGVRPQSAWKRFVGPRTED